RAGGGDMRWRDWAGLAILAALAGPVVRGQTVAAPALRDTHENLHGVLWMQTAAEYQALTRGLYRLAAGPLHPARPLPSGGGPARPRAAGPALDRHSRAGRPGRPGGSEAGRHPRRGRDGA